VVAGSNIKDKMLLKDNYRPDDVKKDPERSDRREENTFLLMTVAYLQLKGPWRVFFRKNSAFLRISIAKAVTLSYNKKAIYSKLHIAI
jgi:hypothetical protein